MIKQYETINSFTRRPVVTQIAAYLVFIGEALTFFICMYINFRNTSTQIGILVFYIVTALIQVIVSIMASYIDPSDNIMIEYRKDTKNRGNMKFDDCLYCDICASYVKETSRHCKVCQRCVQQFDHHCMWINNCIGSKNYNVFFVMIISTFVNMLAYVVGMILLWTEDAWMDYLGPMIAVWVFAVIILVFTILLLNLIGLHIYLIHKGLTTYQFIMMQREQEKKKKMQQELMLKQMQQRKNRSTSIEDNIKVKHNTQQNQTDSQKQPSSHQKTSSINTKQIDHPLHNENLKSESSSNVIFQNKLHLDNDLKTQKSEEDSTYEGKKKVRHVSVMENSQHQANQDYDNMQGPISPRKQNEMSISNFFAKNKSFKFIIGTQIGQIPHSTTHRNKKSSINYFSAKNKKDKSEKKVNKSLFVMGTSKIGDQKSATSLKVITNNSNKYIIQTTPTKIKIQQ